MPQTGIDWYYVLCHFIMLLLYLACLSWLSCLTSQTIVEFEEQLILSTLELCKRYISIIVPWARKSRNQLNCEEKIQLNSKLSLRLNLVEGFRVLDIWNHGKIINNLSVLNVHAFSTIYSNPFNWWKEHQLLQSNTTYWYFKMAFWNKRFFPALFHPKPN